MDYQMCRIEHPALAKCHNKYCSRSQTLNQKKVAQQLKLLLDQMLEKTIQNSDESEGGDLTKILRRLRLESDARQAVDQELEQNEQMILKSYSEYLDLSLELLEKYRIPFKNQRDVAQSYVLNSRVQAEAAENRKTSLQKTLTACPDADGVNKRKRQLEQISGRIAELETKKRDLQERMEQIEASVEPDLVQELRVVREELNEKEWAAAQLNQPLP